MKESICGENTKRIERMITSRWKEEHGRCFPLGSITENYLHARPSNNKLEFLGT